MKESNVGRIAFGFCVGLTMIFTLVSLLTPGTRSSFSIICSKRRSSKVSLCQVILGWRTFEKESGAIEQGPEVPASVGLFRYQCVGYHQQKQDAKKTGKPDVDFCNYIFDVNFLFISGVK